MSLGKKEKEAILSELIQLAENQKIQVRTEKLLREAGYRVRSGRCRVNGRDFIIVDRDQPVTERIDFLLHQLVTDRINPEEISDSLKRLLPKSSQS